MRILLVVLALGAVLAACGGTPATVDAGPQAEFCERYPAALCAVKVACGTYSDAGFSDCVEAERRALQDQCFRAGAGTLVFRPEAAQACLTETALSPPACLIAELGCDLLYNSTDSVDRIFGEVKNGCGTAVCGAGTECDKDCSDPQCHPLRAVGESCDPNRPTATCVREGVCLAEDGGPRAPFVCRPRYTATECFYGVCALGQYCASRVCLPHKTKDTPCTSGAECEDGVCRFSDRRCGALDAGAPCLSPRDCAGKEDDPNFCLGLTRERDGGVADGGLCGPRPTTGQPCSPDWAFSAPLACTVGQPESCLDGQCRRLGHFSDPLGSECLLRPYANYADRYVGYGTCAPGLGCFPAADAHPPSTGRCAALLPDGAPCTTASHCASFTCDSRDGGPPSCLRRAGLHEACGVCLGEFTCALTDAGTSWCVPPIANGESCAYTATCANGRCSRPEAVCTAYSSACTSDSDCESLRCNAGQCAAPGTCLSAY